MREEEELIEDAQRSRAETAKLRDGDEPPPADDVPESDTDSITDDE